MFPSHIIFERNLESIFAHLEFLRSEQAALRLGARLVNPASVNERALRDLALSAQRSAPKRFTHTWAVVELYGALEQLAEGLVRDYLLRLERLVPSFEKLPERISEAHTRKSFELLQNAERLGLVVSEQEIVANLHRCLDVRTDYQLNRDAFALHTANIRSDQIKSVFAQIGIDAVPRRVYQTDVFQAFLDTHEDLRNRERRDGHELRELDELVDLRNEAAHGVPTNFLSLELLDGVAKFARAFGAALLDVVEEEATKLAVEHHGRSAGAVLNVFNSKIVCLRLDQPVRVGDALVGRTPENRFRGGSIQRIEIDGAPVPAASKGEQVGLEVDFLAKPNQEFFVLRGPASTSASFPLAAQSKSRSGPSIPPTRSPL